MCKDRQRYKMWLSGEAMGIAFGYSGRKRGVTLYSRTRDVLPIAIKYGGDGHPRAAGFPCDRLPFL